MPGDEPVLESDHLAERRQCAVAPTVTDTSGAMGTKNLQGYGSQFTVPELCDVIGVIGTHTLLGYDPIDQVVALDVAGGPPFTDPARRQVVTRQGAPERAAFATDLIGQALTARGSAS